MNELPEVETVRRDLDKELSGKKVKQVEVLSTTPFAKKLTKKAISDALEGQKVSGVRRAGLLTIIDLGEGGLLVAEPGPGVRFLRAANKDDVVNATAVVITFTQGGQLRIESHEGEGALHLLGEDELDATFPQIAELGLDPVEEPISWTNFGHMLLPRKDKLKGLLVDPTFVVGIGPVYSDEILHAALLRGDRTGDSLTTQEVRRLYRALVETMHLALKHRGTSLDSGWTDAFGETGGYDEHLEVFGRAGERSRNGRGSVLKMRLANMTHFYCDYQV